MQKLNWAANEIFFRLLDNAGKKRQNKLTVEGYEPLVIMCIGDTVQTPYGEGKRYSFFQYFLQKGDQMYDPEMCFLVVDKRTHREDFANGSVYPAMYQNSCIGVCQYSLDIEYNKLKILSEPLQAKHTLFANDWMASLQQMGFLQ